MKPTLEDPFVKISNEDAKALLTVLKQRLPKSAHEYNLVLMNTRHPRDDVKIYTLNGDLGSEAVVLLIHFRKDFGQDICFSISEDYIPGKPLTEALLATNAVDWSAGYFLTSVDRRISPIIVEISTIEKKNSIIYNPNYQFIFDVDEAQKINFNDVPNNIEIRPLDKANGPSFLADNWKWKRDGTLEYVEGLLGHHPTVGIYVDGNLACGAVVTYHGLIGLLYTDPNYRRMGLAQFCMRYLFKDMAKNGLVPCSSCQIENYMSAAFHKKVGMKMTHETDYIVHTVFSEKL